MNVVLIGRFPKYCIITLFKSTSDIAAASAVSMFWISLFCHELLPPTNRFVNVRSAIVLPPRKIVSCPRPWPQTRDDRFRLWCFGSWQPGRLEKESLGRGSFGGDDV